MGKIFAAYSPTGGTQGALDYLDGDSLESTDLGLVINPTHGRMVFLQLTILRQKPDMLRIQ